MRGLILSAAFGAAALTGCYVSDGTGPAYSGGAYATTSPDGYATTPDLVTVQPGVQVVADYDQPVFFVDGFYWRFNDGYWYRSNNYYAGWYFYERPPVAVLRIDRPYAYAHYRPPGYVARANVRYRAPETITRDHRTVQAAPVYRGGPAAAPVVTRDHRTVAPAPAPAARPAPAATPPARDHRAPPAKDARDHRH
ncbi:MAG TPA: hypothetical protein VHT91_04680 [Kofleriaceae bacterium]|nr:hypothetical protein [Kofleriaceae bacterium]